MRTILKIMCYFTIKEISGVSTLFTLLKWVFFEGQQREFFPARRAKIVENVVGSLGLLHNRYDKNIFYLDLCGNAILDGVNFVGGTLSFDGSMRIRDNQRIDQWDGWQDWRLIDIESRYMDFNAYYVDMIQACMKPGMPTALCTHHVPHVWLNGHMPGHHSFYTGMQDLVHTLPFDPLYNNYLICGHTHRRVIGEVVPGFMGVNVGSDYDVLKTFVLDL